MAHRALGIPIGAVTIVLVGLLGRRAGGDRVGLIAAAICAAYPLMVATDGALMSETLYGALIAGTLLAAWRLLDRPAVPIALATGALIGLAALTRSEALLLVPLLAWPVAVPRGTGLAAARGRRDGRLRGGDRAVDDPQPRPVRAPGADLQQRLDRDRGRQLRPHLPRGQHGRLGHPLHLRAPARRRGGAGADLARRGPRLRPRPRRAAARGRRGPAAAGLGPLAAAAPGDVRGGPRAARDAGRARRLLPAVRAGDRRRAGAAPPRPAAADPAGAGASRSASRRWSATACRGCGTGSRSR